MTFSSLNDSGTPPRSAEPPRVVSGLRRFAQTAKPGAEPEPERCGLCGEIVGEGHGHLVDIQQRSLVCACRACALLFTRPGAAGGRYRTVPDRVWHDPGAPLSAAEWDELRIPVSIAFFFVNSALGQVVASYPSPAGVTECELDLAAWDKMAAGHPLLRALAPDVEAILTVAGPAGQSGQGIGGHGIGDHGIETFLVPIDLCYGLAGSLRLNWRGFDGGAEAHAILSGFLDDLRERSLALTTEGEG
ncbi:MAG: DUF5947 family protein [Trebonia sp.]